ncbi:hypothetical protein KQX54_011243 [Cotesia glomerata]|uniref:T-box domain-containing protein n=1 Tax=Cotesia glomerata TaxID=32391 RepID=A0AAV7J389_COTGL|nr:hypothetical protein KQX54_011243 [Cotesia glomerata]
MIITNDDLLASMKIDSRANENFPEQQSLDNSIWLLYFAGSIFSRVCKPVGNVNQSFYCFQITKLKIDSNPFAKGFRDSSRLTDFERETMESMLAEQQSMRFPHRFPFEMEQLQSGANNLSLEEKALWAARSQILLRAAAAAAVGPYAQLVSPALVYPSASTVAGSSHQQQQHQQQQQQQQLGHLWWASSLGPTLFAAAHHHQQQQLAASSSQQSPPPGPAAPRPIYPSALALAHHRFSPYPSGIAGRKPSVPSAPSPSASRRATPSPTDSLYREAQDLSPS